ncbi:MAG: hypothetical protein ACRCSN_01755 [Dermatophilaceae bacterium]
MARRSTTPDSAHERVAGLLEIAMPRGTGIGGTGRTGVIRH